MSSGDTNVSTYTPWQALSMVVQAALADGHIKRGLHQSVKALDRGIAVLCLLSMTCTEEHYRNLVIALSAQHGVPIVNIPSSDALGMLAGLYRNTESGQPARVMACSCCTITSWDKTTPWGKQLEMLLQSGNNLISPP